MWRSKDWKKIIRLGQKLAFRWVAKGSYWSFIFAAWLYFMIVSLHWLPIFLNSSFGMNITPQSSTRQDKLMLVPGRCLIDFVYFLTHVQSDEMIDWDWDVNPYWDVLVVIYLCTWIIDAMQVLKFSLVHSNTRAKSGSKMLPKNFSAHAH